MTNSGQSAWRQLSNNNHMRALQSTGAHPDTDTGSGTGTGSGTVEIASFGASAIRITTPAGLSILIDPWRNPPDGTTDWFYHDFPETTVDIGLSTHAHFDHDALHRLDANMLIDRLTGSYRFADLSLTGLADKHATDFSHSAYDLHAIYRYLGRPEMRPPDNARSWDNSLIIAETGGLRILHWGDNRADPPPDIWDAIGKVDILLLPVDDSQHVLSHANVAAIAARLAPAVLIPIHSFNMATTRPNSTLLTADKWLAAQPRTLHHPAPTAQYSAATLPTEPMVHSFGGHLAFDPAAWHAAHGLQVTPQP
jgi:L-ascorbate metabolism protein UlaG (beta-lactamase superfamily)